MIESLPENPLDGLTDEQVDAILDSLYTVDEWPPLDCEDDSAGFGVTSNVTPSGRSATSWPSPIMDSRKRSASAG